MTILKKSVSSYAAPTELGIFREMVFYKYVAPAALPSRIGQDNGATGEDEGNDNVAAMI
jgi:hypothetical protein